MEYLEGETLPAASAQKAPIPHDKLSSFLIAIPVAEHSEAAHREGIIHRDPEAIQRDV